MIKRSILSVLIVILVICQMYFVIPDKTYGASEKAGDTFTVRVGYFGDDTDYRTKAKLSKSKMNSLPKQRGYYTNMTKVGTIMTTVAEGPTLKRILNEAGIDVGSVRLIHVRATDADGNAQKWFMEFPANKYIGSSLYYYPNLVENWEKTGEGRGIPQEGALKGEKKVDTIIATRSYSTKSKSEAKKLSFDDLSTEDSYRLCAGQKKLKELVETKEVSSNESAKFIFGIDVTLWGSPKKATKITLNIKDKNIKVGSTKRISAQIKGQELFDDKVDKKVKWSSSNEEIATVDKEGNVTVKKEGKVTITAKTSNGLEKSVTINGTEEQDPDESEKEENASGMGGTATGSGKGEGLGKGTFLAKEVQVGDRIVEEVEDERPVMEEEAIELEEEKVDPQIIYTASCVAIVLFIIGLFISIIGYRREV